MAHDSPAKVYRWWEWLFPWLRKSACWYCIGYRWSTLYKWTGHLYRGLKSFQLPVDRLWWSCCPCFVCKVWNSRRPKTHSWMFFPSSECFYWGFAAHRVWVYSHCRIYRSYNYRYCSRWKSLSIHCRPVLRKFRWWHRPAGRSCSGNTAGRSSRRICWVLILSPPRGIPYCLCRCFGHCCWRVLLL